MGLAQQAMEWISWYGVNYLNPKSRLDESIRPGEYKVPSLSYEKMIEKEFATYESSMRATWPSILGAIASVASYDFKLYRKADNLSQKLAGC